MVNKWPGEGVDLRTHYTYTNKYNPLKMVRYKYWTETKWKSSQRKALPGGLLLKSKKRV